MNQWVPVKDCMLPEPTPETEAYRMADLRYRGHIVNLLYWYAPWPRMRVGGRFSRVKGYSHPQANWPAVLKEDR